MHPKKQENPYSRPWSISTFAFLYLWKLTWLLLCQWTPKPMNRWRLLILKLFKAKITGYPFVHSSVKIVMPWHLTLKHRACLGENTVAYSLGEIEIRENATVAQEVYLCTGTHDFESPTFQLVTSKITIGKNAFIGARAMVLPGVTIGENAIVGAMSVVSKNINQSHIVVGNPATKIGTRKLSC